MTIERRVVKLEKLTKEKRARSKKPFVGSDWTAAELTSLANSWHSYPLDLAEKRARTEWGPASCEDIDDELLERRLRKLGDSFSLDVDGIMARLKG